MIAALAPILALEAELGPAGWIALGATALGAGIYALVNGIKAITQDSNYSQNQASVNKLNAGVKSFIATKPKLQDALANLTAQKNQTKDTTTIKVIEAQIQAINNNIASIDKLKTYQDANGNIFNLLNEIFEPGPANWRINLTKNKQPYDAGANANTTRNAITNFINMLNELNSTGIFGNMKPYYFPSDYQSMSGYADYETGIDGITSPDWNTLTNLLTGNTTTIFNGKTIPTSLSGIGIAIGAPTNTGAPTIPIPTLTPSISINISLSVAGTIAPTNDIVERIKEALEDEEKMDELIRQFGRSFIMAMVKMLTRTLTQTRTITRSEKYEKPKKPRVPRKKKKAENAKRPDYVKRIFLYVGDHSVWIRGISFEFQTIQDKYSDEKGTMKFFLKDNKTIITKKRVNRGTFSFIAIDAINGAGYRYWSQFNRKKIVNKGKVLSWYLKRITAQDRMWAIPNEHLLTKGIIYN